MRLKKIMLVTLLLLAVLTISAVSASEDISSDDKLAASDIIDDSIDESSADEIIASEENDELNLEADDFSANITEEVNLDDESDPTVVSFYCPEGADDGYINIEIRGDFYYDENINLDSEDIGSIYNITLSDLDIDSRGTSTVSLYFVNTTDYASLTLASGTLTVTKNLTADEFSIRKEVYCEYSSDYVVKVWNYPVAGTLIVNVDGNKRYTCDVGKYDYIYVQLTDLNITANGKYEIAVLFNSTDGEELELTTFNLTVELQDDYVYVYSTLYLNEEEDDDLFYIDDYENGVIGTVTVTVNGKQCYSKTFTKSNNITYLYVSTSDLTLTGIGYANYTVIVTYLRNNTEKHQVEKTVRFCAYPTVYKPSYMYAGEKEAVIINAPSGTTGTMTLYYDLYNSTSDEYYKVKFASSTISNGFGRISLESLAKGSYEFYLEYAVANYQGSRYFDVDVQDNTKGFTSSISATTITVGSSTTVSLKGNASTRNAYVYVDGVEYAEFPFNLGEMIVSVDDLTVGTHYITVRYIYSKQNITFSDTYVVTVKAKTTPTTKTVTKLTLKKVKVKKSAKKLVIKATLKINSKTVKGKKITFKFKNKKYTAKTNKKGVAKVTIKKKVLKKLKVGKKVKYQAKYGTTTKKISVKVKK